MPATFFKPKNCLKDICDFADCFVSNNWIRNAAHIVASRKLYCKCSNVTNENFFNIRIAPAKCAWGKPLQHIYERRIKRCCKTYRLYRWATCNSEFICRTTKKYCRRAGNRIRSSPADFFYKDNAWLFYKLFILNVRTNDEAEQRFVDDWSSVKPACWQYTCCAAYVFIKIQHIFFDQAAGRMTDLLNQISHELVSSPCYGAMQAHHEKPSW